ncbi:ABC transporter substrate-binding protein [Psittacicella gerlachiana]|uniref:Putrescine-binding periplasmic protein n=1 Tax=Psittacicella gerlachiana TaxID=2028574 RepID=A0A3A1Y3E4_9GAMM|nr:spermidine/putrescine ABC transporter substrate-binding protein [Psittacicella gerlachiana]RIY32085.1 hypothetical protein CKF59_07195 [Psittacicella gerlachiana]
MSKAKLFITIFILVLIVITGYIFLGNKNETKESLPKQKLYVYNWTEYITSDLLNKFTKETGIEVVYTTYESNEEMYAKLKLNSNSSQPYDIVVPSNHYVAKLIAEKLIQPLDLTRLQVENILPETLNKPFDPNNQYSVPYTYGFTTIGIDKSYAPNLEIKSLNDLWKPEYQDLMLLNDQRDLFSLALKALGYDPNTTDPEQIKQAYEKLRQLMPKVKTFNSDAPEVPFVNREVVTGVIWTGSAFRGSLDDPNLTVVWPEEGAVAFIDSFVIPNGAKNLEAAYAFINFMLEPENAVEILQNLGFQPANRLIKDLLPLEWQNSNILFPPEWVFEKSTFNADLDNKTLEIYNKYWNQLRVSGQK